MEQPQQQMQQQVLVTKLRDVQLVAIDDGNLEESHELLGGAFYDDIGFTYVFGGVDREAVKWMNVRMLDIAKLEHGILECTIEEGKMKSVAVWSPPADPTSFWTLIVREGLIKFPFFYGFRALWRLIAVIDVIDKWKNENKDCWYLDLLAVLREEQGRGIGSASLAASLKKHIDNKGLKSMLVTAKEANVRLYIRHGFEVVDTHKFSDEFTLYFMRREAQTPLNPES